MELFRRENYLNRIRGFYHDTEMIKVITGVRRCGKSSLMRTIVDELSEQGFAQSQIVYIDLDSPEYMSIDTANKLRDLLFAYDKQEEIIYLLIDEIQNVKGFERVINALRGTGRFSIFITGSNSYLLSGELATKLTGRYIEFEMMPLTFEEYIAMRKFYGKSVGSDITAEFDRYLLEGGFPRTIFYDNDDDKRLYNESIISEIFEKDIRRRVKIRNREAFEKVQTYLINNFGATTSVTNILSDLNKMGLYIKRETLHRYIRTLVDAKILIECKRFDLKSRRSINGEQKYYLADMGFWFATNTDNRINYGPAMENVVHSYAKSKGYKVSVGRVGRLECDFILRNNEPDYCYIQVAMTIMADQATEDREYAPLEKIEDNYRKYVLTRNDPIQRRNGIIHRNVPEFMAQGELF